ncbi:hypothetical protein [Acrocarpospora catenulata]|uniref:hypothetical protein n=1 Tax=Acrocarpospora catenulata TaxID=2836182 RepID=UPI001BDA5122|nr:hypothetical protein [Acrocarpospora catenulata]
MAVDDQYTRIMARLAEALPNLADQLDQEVRRGRAVSEQKLRQEGRYEERASRLAETELPPLGKTDIAVIPYTADESIELIREALVTLAETMYLSRKVTLDTLLAYDMEPEIQFGDAELEDVSRFNLRDDTEQARLALQTVQELLSESPETDTEGVR